MDQQMEDSSVIRPADLQNQSVEKKQSDSTDDTHCANLAVSDFRILKKTDYFIDKTLLIKEMWVNPATATLITPPKGSGKSVSISMMKYFFEIQVNEDAVQHTDAKLLSSNKPIIDTSNYELFADLKIARYPRIMQDLGKFPVIYVDGSCTEDVSTTEHAVDKCRRIVRECYLQHKYLLKSTKLSEGILSVIQKWCDETAFLTIPKWRVYDGLRELCRYLHKHFDRRCVILIDDYDSIVMRAISLTSSEPCLWNIKSTVRASLLAVIKHNNNNMERAFITGTKYRAEVWDTVNNVCIYPSSFKEFMDDDNRYNQFYGTETKKNKNSI